MRFVAPAVLTLVICLIIGKSLDIQTYRDYHTKEPVYVSGEQQEFLYDTQIVQSPKDETWLLRLIDSAQSEIRIAVYIFTVPSLREALIRAQKRGVNVKVILEKNPYNSIGINRETVEVLQENNIAFNESNERYFSFMHAKYMILDDTWIIATANWTRSSFSTNREFFLIGKDTAVLSDLKSIFEADFSGKKGYSQDSKLIVGPTNARERLIGFMESTREMLSLYGPSLTDEALISELQKICDSGKKIRILIDENEGNVQSSKEGRAKSCPEIRMMKKPQLHAKSIIRDNQSAFVGSFNFTKNSLEENREIGIFIEKKSITDLVNSFQQDWEKSVAF